MRRSNEVVIETGKQLQFDYDDDEYDEYEQLLSKRASELSKCFLMNQFSVDRRRNVVRETLRRASVKNPDKKPQGILDWLHILVAI